MGEPVPSCSSRRSSSSGKDTENKERIQTPPKKRKYFQSYNRRWEEDPDLKGWLHASKKGSHFAYCNACHLDINIKAGKLQLQRHSEREKHRLACRSKLKQKPLTNMVSTGLDTQVKDAELKLVAFVVEHNLPMKIMDHVPELLRAVCPDSNIAKSIKSARTKTTNIIKNVTGVYSLQKLVQTLQESKFSLIIDESTDRTTAKHLCLVTRVLLNNRIQDCFLGLLPVESAKAEVLFNQIISFFDKNKIPYSSNLIGFAADGASNMMGCDNSVASRFQGLIPDIFILKCICHSFALCASNACSKLPHFVESVTKDIYNYFSNSPKRIGEFKEFQNFCNVKVHKILHPCQTRWLSLLSVVERIIEQYDALVLFFTDASFNNRDDIKSQNILEQLNNPVYKLYLQFLQFSLPLFVNFNRQMQSEDPQITNIYSSVTTVVKTLLDYFIKPQVLLKTEIYEINYQNPRNMLPLEEMYFGAAVSISTLRGAELQTLKTNCLSFYIEGITQILQRFPLKNNLLKDLSFANPSTVRQKTINSIAKTVSQWPNLLDSNKLQTIDNEWRLLKNLDSIPAMDNIFEFWSNVANVKRGDNTPMFGNLTDFIFKILILPHSSANVERVFSTINIIKNKQRNKLGTDTIIGLLHSKRLVSTCFNFKSDNDLRRLMTKDIYNKE